MIDLGSEDGYLDVKIGETTQHLDVYKVWNQITDLTRDTQGQPLAAFHDGVVGLMEGAGFPGPISHRTADRFVVGVCDHVEGLRKKDGAGSQPGSPSTTEPTPSPSPEATN